MNRLSATRTPHPYRPVSYLPRLDRRPVSSIDMVVIHCTELPDLAMARAFGERILHPRSRTGNCGHYYVDRDGRIQQWVDHQHTAHHVRGYNKRSVGIELVNTGRYPDWLHSEGQDMHDPYTEPQIAALETLLRSLQRDLAGLRWIAGHEDLDRARVPASDDPSLSVYRKRDPGPLFPWARVLAGTALRRFPPDPESD